MYLIWFSRKLKVVVVGTEGNGRHLTVLQRLQLGKFTSRNLLARLVPHSFLCHRAPSGATLAGHSVRLCSGNGSHPSDTLSFYRQSVREVSKQWQKQCGLVAQESCR